MWMQVEWHCRSIQHHSSIQASDVSSQEASSPRGHAWSPWSIPPHHCPVGGRLPFLISWCHSTGKAPGSVDSVWAPVRMDSCWSPLLWEPFLYEGLGGGLGYLVFGCHGNAELGVHICYHQYILYTTGLSSLSTFRHTTLNGWVAKTLSILVLSGLYGILARVHLLHLAIQFWTWVHRSGQRNRSRMRSSVHSAPWWPTPPYRLSSTCSCNPGGVAVTADGLLLAQGWPDKPAHSAGPHSWRCSAILLPPLAMPASPPLKGACPAGETTTRHISLGLPVEAVQSQQLNSQAMLMEARPQGVALLIGPTPVVAPLPEWSSARAGRLLCTQEQMPCSWRLHPRWQGSVASWIIHQHWRTLLVCTWWWSCTLYSPIFVQGLAASSVSWCGLMDCCLCTPWSVHNRAQTVCWS